MSFLSLSALVMIFSVFIRHQHSNNELIFIILYCIPIAISFIFSLSILLEKNLKSLNFTNMKNQIKKLLIILNMGEELPTWEEILYLIPYAFVFFVLLSIVSILEKL